MSEKLTISEKIEKAVFEEIGFSHNAVTELKELLSNASDLIEGYHGEMGSHVSVEINKELFELNFECDMEKIDLDQFCFEFSQARDVISSQVLSEKKLEFSKTQKEKLTIDFAENKKKVLNIVSNVKKIIGEIKEFMTKRK